MKCNQYPKSYPHFQTGRSRWLTHLPPFFLIRERGGGGDGVSGQLPIRLKIRLHPKATVHVCRQNRKALHFHISLDISTQKIRLYLLLSINSFHLHAFVRLLKLPLFSTLPVPWVTSTRDRRALI